MSLVYESHICNCDSSRSCIFCLSHEQQAHEVAKLFQSSYRNPYGYSNSNRCHFETPLIASHRAAPAATSRQVAFSNLDASAHHRNYPPGFQPIEPKILRFLLTETSGKSQKVSEGSNSRGHYEKLQTFSHGVTDCTASITTASSSLLTISHCQTDEPNLHTIEQQAHHSSPSSTKISNESRVDNKSFTVEPTDRVNLSEICKSEYFVQKSMSDSISDGVSIRNLAAKKLHKVIADNTMLNSTMDKSSSSPTQRKDQVSSSNKSHCTSNILQAFETEPSVQDLLPSSQFQLNLIEMSRVSDRHISMAQAPAPVRKKCKCTKCSVERGNKTRGSNGKLQHACHINGYGQVFSDTAHLKQHLDSHSGKKKCTRRDTLVSHDKKCQQPICDAETGNKVSMLNGKTLHTGKKNFFCEYCDKGFARKDKLKVHLQLHITVYACHIPDCGRYFKYEWYLRRHLDWHSGKKNFKCAHCDKGFVRKSALSQHVRVHMPVKKCEVKKKQSNSK